MSPRVNVRLGEPVQAALMAAAALRGCRPATLADELLTGAILVQTASELAPRGDLTPPGRLRSKAPTTSPTRPHLR